MTALFIPKDVSAHQQVAWKALIAQVSKLSATTASTGAAAAAGGAASFASQIAALQAQVNALAAAAASNTVSTYATSGLPFTPCAVRETSPGAVQAADAGAIGTAGVIGVATSVTGVGASVATLGDVTYAGWRWAPAAPVYLGANGALTQPQPANGVVVQIGWATSAHSMFVRPSGPMLPLAALPADPADTTAPYVNSGDGTLRYWTGAAWVHLGTLDQVSPPEGPVYAAGQRVTGVADAEEEADAVSLRALYGALAQRDALIGALYVAAGYT